LANKFINKFPKITKIIHRDIDLHRQFIDGSQYY